MAYRVVLIHAVREAMAPVRQAFSALWPEAEVHDLLDSSLSADLAADAGVIDPDMVKRFRLLATYAARPAHGRRHADGILFTCSAFGPAIDAARRDLHIPVLKPNEAAFEEALRKGPRIGLVVTFEPSLRPMLDELRGIMAERGLPQDGVVGVVVPGAFDALRAGQPADHDARVVEAVAALPALDAVILGQFSMAGAAAGARRVSQSPVLTTPESAVGKLRELVTRS